ncbi:MAG: alpha/beta fold hydrolase [Actinophytocola sp.]|nr:alpha/beta fold hydrolase [Actinophytocola sp.]
MLLVVVVLMGVLGAIVGGMYVAQRSLIYHPSPGPLPSASDVLPGGEDVTLHTSDGLALSAWFFPANGSANDAGTDGAADAETSPVVLVAQGNGGNRGGRVDLARALTRHDISVLLFDYRGYGGNQGDPTEDGLARDVRAAYGYLVSERDVPRERLFYFGESLGSGVVSELATEHPPAGMLLRSPFPDLAAVGSEHYPWLPVRLLLKDRYPVADNVSALDDVPMVVVYGTDDSIVPPALSEQVAAAADMRRVAVEGAGHNDRVLLDGPELIGALVELVASTTR